MTAGTWYVKTGRTAVNWGTDVSGGVATVDIAKLVVGAVNEQWFLFARAGQPVTADQVTAAQAETTGGPVPAPILPSNGVAPGGKNTYATILTPATGLTYNADGTVATQTVAGVTTSYTYNADGTVATEARAGITRTYTYNADGTLASVA